MRNQTTILCIGDSITDGWRMVPESAPLGKGYPRLLQDRLIARYPARRFKVINQGISGDTVAGLDERWDIEVLPCRPNWLIILIGVNDAGRALQRKPGWEAHTPERFREHYRRILQRTTMQRSRHILLLEPFIISVDRTDAARGLFRRQLRPYQRIVTELSREFRARLIRLQDVFDRQLRYRVSRTFSPDTCHPNLTGHMVIADSILDIM